MMVYVDAGDEDAAEPFRCRNGEPTGSYLYRKMTPTLRERGRVIVPEIVGFGRSEKYDRTDEYSFEMCLPANRAFLEELDTVRSGHVVIRDDAVKPGRLESFERLSGTNSCFDLHPVELPVDELGGHLCEIGLIIHVKDLNRTRRGANHNERYC